jgi:LacI family transcriptional regulator
MPSVTMKGPRELVLAEDPPTALFTSQNLITIDSVRAIHDLHMQRHFALIGFDDVALVDVVEPGLTVIAQDPTSTLIPRGSGELPPGGGS